MIGACYEPREDRRVQMIGYVGGACRRDTVSVPPYVSVSTHPELGMYNSAGGVIVTNEIVTSIYHGMQSCLYAFCHIRAPCDPVAFRKPYAIETIMGQLLDWKRYEANSMVEFTDVGENNVNSIFRRSLVIYFKSQFFDVGYIQDHVPDAEAKGIFPTDQTLKNALGSGPVARSFLKLLHTCWAGNSRQDCYDLIERYAAGGDDEGLTEETVRKACGLPPKNSTAKVDLGAEEMGESVDPQFGPVGLGPLEVPPVIAMAGDNTIVVQEAPSPSAQQKKIPEFPAHLVKKSQRIMEYLLTTSKDRITQSQARLVTAIPPSEAATVLDDLVKAGMWFKLEKSSGQKKPSHHRKNSAALARKDNIELKIAAADHVYMPKIIFGGDMAGICDMKIRDQDRTYPETFNAGVVKALQRRIRSTEPTRASSGKR